MVNWVVKWALQLTNVGICIRAPTLLTLQFNLISFACVVKSYTSQWPFRPFTLFCVFLYTIGAAWAHISAFYSKTTRQVYGAMKFCVPLSPFSAGTKLYLYNTHMTIIHACELFVCQGGNSTNKVKCWISQTVDRKLPPPFFKCVSPKSVGRDFIKGKLTKQFCL